LKPGGIIFTTKACCKYNNKGVLKMSPKQRILAIKLAEKINKNSSYAEKIGIVIENKKK